MNITAREFLAQIERLQIRIGTLSEQLQYLRSAAEYPTPQLSNMPKSPNSNVHNNEDAIIRITEKQQQIADTQRQLCDIISVIDLIDNPIHHAVIVKRYQFNKEWMMIADELHMSQAQVYRVHNAALSEIEKLIVRESK